MFSSIQEYLDALKQEMQGADSALQQDAQADAYEHLFTALMIARELAPDTSDAEALTQIVEEYGSPEETALAYKVVERRTPISAKAPSAPNLIVPGSISAGFFGVYTDQRTWGALLYMLIAFVTGTLYFSWALIGVVFTVPISIFIFGLPLALLFLLSVRGLALMEGRLVEGLLAIRMPRRPLFSHANMPWFDRLKALISDKITWCMLGYMLLQFVLGQIYLILVVALLGSALALIFSPLLHLVFPDAVQFSLAGIALHPLLSLLFSIGGALILTAFLHLVRWLGQTHGKIAKAMLVA